MSAWSPPVSPDHWLGWDLGGAHLKAVRLDGSGRVGAVAQVPCPLWQGLQRLEEALDRVLEEMGSGYRCHALTMTGELVDLFDDRAQGVTSLVGAMEHRFPGQMLRIYAGGNAFVGPDESRAAVDRIASANWSASASLAARHLPEGLLVDVGSTTTDLVPFGGGKVLALGQTDHERLLGEELVYTGITRTPVMAVARKAPIDGHNIPLMAEHFSTMADVYRLTGDLPDHADLLPAADNREKAPEASARRLARMVGLDLDSRERTEWRRLARYLAERQLRSIEDACDRVLSRGLLGEGAPFVGAGVGRFLAAGMARRYGRPYLGYDAFFDHAPARVADCAPAAAVASLAAAL